MMRTVIVGGGPAGYEAAHVAAQQGADVTLIEATGIGGAAVLTDCVPSKTLIATARSASLAADSASLGVRVEGEPIAPASTGVDLRFVFDRVAALAAAQSDDIKARLIRDGVNVLHGHGDVSEAGTVRVVDGRDRGAHAPYGQLLIATGARPRELPEAATDGERILNWKQVWNLTEIPEHLIVVGSGVTGAEFAGAFTALGGDVTLVSSRDRVLPTQDSDAADVVEAVFVRRGMQVLSRSRALAVTRTEAGVIVTLADGQQVQGSHCLLAVGALPNTEDLGLERLGVRTTESGHIEVDRVSRTNVMGVYAAGDVTGVLALASVAAMQGRIAMWHAFGDAVAPLQLAQVSSAVFTDPEIAAVGVPPATVATGEVQGTVRVQQLATNPRAKMQGVHDGFIKLVARPDGVVAGGVVVAPRASDLIHAISIAVAQHLTVDDLAQIFTVYPSISGSVAEAARRLHIVD
ncbi:MAG: NAD(P)H-quinone dehydrogenase [Candidatus Nanopelagicales bacterium]